MPTKLVKISDQIPEMPLLGKAIFSIVKSDENPFARIVGLLSKVRDLESALETKEAELKNALEEIECLNMEIYDLHRMNYEEHY